jgi:hypothetical protein
MNLFKSIQHMVLASLVMTVAMPMVTVAMARNQRSAQRSGPVQNRAPQGRQARNHSKKQPLKMPKRSLLNRIKDNWKYIALGGCALVATVVVLWNLNNNKNIGPNNKNLGPVVPHDADCAICLNNFYKLDADHGLKHQNQIDRLPCNHFLHRECMDEWAQSGRSEGRNCPTCRQPAAGKEAATLKK